MNPAGGHLHDEEQVEGDEARRRPDFDGCEVDRAEHVPVRLKELLPGGLPLSVACGLDPVLPQNAADGGVGDLVPEVGERALDAVVAPCPILPGHAQDQLDDLRRDAGTSNGAPSLAVVPLLGYELPVPAEDGVGREGGTDFAEHLSPEHPALDRQAPPLVIVEPDPPLAVRLLHYLVLGAEVLDDLLLLPVDQAGQDREEEVPGLEDESHGWFRLRPKERESESGTGRSSRGVAHARAAPTVSPRRSWTSAEFLDPTR